MDLHSNQPTSNDCPIQIQPNKCLNDIMTEMCSLQPRQNLQQACSWLLLVYQFSIYTGMMAVCRKLKQSKCSSDGLDNKRLFDK